MGRHHAPPPPDRPPRTFSAAPIYEELLHTMTSTSLDAQSLAFRDNPDPVPDGELADFAAATHAPLPTGADPAGGQGQPHHDGAPRGGPRPGGPKTVDEARSQLAARIANPLAPDGLDVAGAYDQLAAGGER